MKDKVNYRILMALQDEAQGMFTDEQITYTGIGKVNSAYFTTKLICNERPDIIINLGSVGSPKIKAGTIVNCTKFIQRDMDMTPLGFEKYHTAYDIDTPITLANGVRVHEYMQGTCGTGDSFDTSGEAIAYDLVDMEAYAIANICRREKIDFLCLKYVTDGADGASADTWEASLKECSKALDNAFKLIKASYLLS